MKKLKFYDVDKDYIDFLQNAEIDNRGFTCVPNMDYGPLRKQKFLCGVVLKVNEINYYVPVTSYKKQQSENILIIFKDDKNNPVKGSLRFNYMIPVPDRCISLRDIKAEPDKTRRIFLDKQIKYIQSITNKVLNKAARTYKIVTKNSNPFLTNHACDFKFLEQKCLEYEEMLNRDMDKEIEEPNIGDDMEL